MIYSGYEGGDIAKKKNPPKNHKLRQLVMIATFISRMNDNKKRKKKKVNQIH